jgi:hypothetical protein
MDGDYLESRGSVYRLTILSKGPRRDCSDYEDVVYPRCGSGEHTNGLKDREIYMVLDEDDNIQKIYFHDSDTNSTNDRECVDFRAYY